MYGGRNKRVDPPQPAFVPAEGVDLKAVTEGGITDSPLISSKEMDFYVEELNKQGLARMFNWYRTCEFLFLYSSSCFCGLALLPPFPSLCARKRCIFSKHHSIISIKKSS